MPHSAAAGQPGATATGGPQSAAAAAAEAYAAAAGAAELIQRFRQQPPSPAQGGQRGQGSGAADHANVNKLLGLSLDDLDHQQVGD